MVVAAETWTGAATGKNGDGQQADNDGSERFHDPPPASCEASGNRGAQSASDFCSRGLTPLSIIIDPETRRRFVNRIARIAIVTGFSSGKRRYHNSNSRGFLPLDMILAMLISSLTLT
jgi:hypothetical protein